MIDSQYLSSRDLGRVYPVFGLLDFAQQARRLLLRIQQKVQVLVLPDSYPMPSRKAYHLAEHVLLVFAVYY